MNKPEPAGARQRFGHAAAQRPKAPTRATPAWSPQTAGLASHTTCKHQAGRIWECLWTGINIYVDKIQNHRESRRQPQGAGSGYPAQSRFWAAGGSQETQGGQQSNSTKIEPGHKPYPVIFCYAESERNTLRSGQAGHATSTGNSLPATAKGTVDVPHSGLAVTRLRAELALGTARH